MTKQTALERTIAELGPEGIARIDLTQETMPRLSAFKVIHGIKSVRETEITLNYARTPGKPFPVTERRTFCNKVHHAAINTGDYVYSRSSVVKPSEFRPVTCLNCLKIILGLREEQAKLRAAQTNPMNRRAKTAFFMDYGTYEREIARAYDLPGVYEGAAIEEWDNDTARTFIIKREPLGDWDTKRLARFVESGGGGEGMAYTLLTDLCNKGVIAPGTYVIEISW